MKQLLSMVFVLLVITTASATYAAGVIQLPKTGQSICYNGSGMAVACSGTGQDGELQPGLAWPTPRFSSNGDQTVTDLLTGLVWSQNANPAGATKTWQAALDYIKVLNSQNYLGYNDWRLPNRKELMSLVNWGQSSSNIWLNTQGFSAVQSSDYWSGSTGVNSPNGAWHIYMYGSNVNYYSNSKSNSYYVWPVRSGQYWTLDTLTIAPGSTNLGNRPVGITSSTQTLQIRNSGVTVAALTGISFTGADASQFSIALGGPTPCPNLAPTMAAGASCTLTVSASVTSSGAKSANLTFTTATASQDIPYTLTAYSTVAGTITDQATGLPLSGATVTLNTGPVVTTDGNGRYDFGQLVDGSYGITVSKTGYQTTSVNSLVVSAIQSSIANVNLPTTGFLNLPTQTLPTADLSRAYSTTILVQGGTAPYTFSIATGSLPGGLTINSTTGGISGTATASGTASFTLRVTDSASTVAEASRSINVAGQLLVTTPTLPAGEVAQSYSSAITTSGGSGAVTFSVSSGALPTGLTLSSTGMLSGTSTNTGTSSFTVTATDAVGRSVSRSYTVTIAPAFAITTSRLNDALIGVAYSQSLSGAGGVTPYSWEIVSGSLPTGLVLNAATGVISGTPTVAATPNITFGLRDATSRLVSKALAVNAVAALGITTAVLPDASTGGVYSTAIQVSGGKSPFTYSLQGSLPSGLTLNTASGTISGTSNTVGIVNFGITVTDDTWPTPQSAATTLSIRTNPDTAPTVTAFTLPATSNSLAVAISRFTASDDAGVTGYLISESATAPLVSAGGWSATVPTTYTVAGQGLATLYAWAKDGAGHVSASLNASVTVDSIAPTVTQFTAPSGSTGLTIIVTMAATDNAAVTGYLISESATPPLPGTAGWNASALTGYTASGFGSKTLYAWAKDALGNVSAARTAGVVFDNMPPSFSQFILPTTINSASVNLTNFSASDNTGITGWCLTETADIASCQWTANKPTGYTFAASGFKTLYAFVKDGASNSASSSATTTYVPAETNGPVLSVSTLANGAITNNATLNINGTVSDVSGVAGVTVNAASVTITSGTFSAAVTLQPGSNTITTVATDTLGNTTTDTRTITLDQAAPTLTASAPADNSKTTQSTVAISGTINETSTVTVKVNAGTPQSASITGTTYSATANLASGLNTITITATDLASNTSSAVRTVTYDNTNPSLAISSPNQDITTALGSVTISGTVSDTITTAVVTITADGQIEGGGFAGRIVARGQAHGDADNQAQRHPEPRHNEARPAPRTA